MKIQGLGKKLLLPACAAGLVALACASAFADMEVNVVDPAKNSTQAQQKPSNLPPDSQGLMREHLWEGSFDRAGDATRNVEQRLLEGMDLGCEKYNPNAGPRADAEPNGDKYLACIERQKQAKYYGQEATGIREQQRTFSDISKLSDAASVAAVGGAIYGELGLKNNNQATSYQQAANIQKVAGQANYATGATDLILGATAYISQKHRLEEMKEKLNSNITVNGKVLSPDVSQANSAITAAIEQTKQAAYSHMLYGAGKMAAGYASIYAAKRSAKQAANLRSIEMDQIYQPMAPMPAGPAGPVVVPLNQGSATPPNYVNNTPNFIYPNNNGLSAPANSGTAKAAIPSSSNGGSGSSAAPSPAGMRALASAGSGSKGGLSGAPGGAPAAGSLGASSAPASQDSDKEKETKEAVGNSFEVSLTGGIRAMAGHSSDSGSGDSGGLGSLLGNLAGNANGGGNTNISPSQVYQEATQGTEEVEGSMAGVSSGSDTSLFDLVRKSLTHAQELGNVGIAKNVEVK